MTDLSPAAQAVLDDAHNRWLNVDDDIPAQVAAAALRAAADQVVHNRVCRMELHLIADELEAANG